MLFFILALVFYVISFFKKQEREMSYEETKAYFASGKGYLNQLSTEDRQKLMAKMEDTPFGL